MECTVENKKLIPLSSVVKASIIDTFADIGRSEQRNYHFAARGLRKLYTEALPKIKHKVWLHVNANTHTATLPLDFSEALFIGFVDQRWHIVPMKLNNSIADRKNIIDVPCDDTKCPKCAQDTSICNDLAITETTNLIVINDFTYTETIVKKLYPNGDYYLETTTPILNINTDVVEDVTRKEFIVNFDLKPCGCLETSETNLTNLQNYCPDTYCNYYAPCETECCVDYGGYKIFEESGLIQFDTRFPYDRIYLEYTGFISKINGQYYVPYVAFETLVEWTKYKQIQNKLNVPHITIARWEDNYKKERSNMEKVLGRVRLSQIIQAITMLPKFDFDYGVRDWYSCFTAPPASTLAATTTSSTVSSTSSSTTTIIGSTCFILNVKCGEGIGSPVAGETTYQNNVLIGATDLAYCLLAKQVLTIKDGDFSFDAVTGIIDISPNIFIDGDTLIAHYNKNL